NGSANYIINGAVGSQTFIENGTSSGWIQIEVSWSIFLT
ncbi:unnamed protein product, partial [marine sediment metagenome]